MAFKLLTTDDSSTIRKIVKKTFAEYDCELFEAINGEEGLAIAEKERPDVILLDVSMPVLNGLEMLEKLKEKAETKEIAVIMLTAESGKTNVAKAVKLGVKDYIVKPFKGNELIERVGKFISLKK